ncbi:hypothetical protein VD0002_g9871 [Verticillium dahliae]|uniref:Uncharacterized protein n=1 Tax=Verticillium dahliae TaxID=27337 RepID=A0AA45AJC7_VERDA|nr:hypothetical protein BJF96_g7505 [Verticillium dahliae]PNH47656.1 hypothetical protein VD0004_g686 [Verticillium dahliae]PNH51111.1 hypothetical protein VD0003_g6123 [Verticillium dahliae]PNH55719.1 hypothetical protein VD0002_g9871 [Verticillium dahliae]PNH76238.1 hypothetical protein VD0001_g1323 [Verticillium dahliae]
MVHWPIGAQGKRQAGRLQALSLARAPTNFFQGPRQLLILRNPLLSKLTTFDRTVDLPRHESPAEPIRRQSVVGKHPHDPHRSRRLRFVRLQPARAAKLVCPQRAITPP